MCNNGVSVFKLLQFEFNLCDNIAFTVLGVLYQSSTICFDNVIRFASGLT